VADAERPDQPTTPAADEPDVAEALELRDELLVACRDVLLGVGTTVAAALVAHIDALLDLDDEVSPGSQRLGRDAHSESNLGWSCGRRVV